MYINTKIHTKMFVAHGYSIICERVFVYVYVYVYIGTYVYVYTYKDVCCTCLLCYM